MSNKRIVITLVVSDEVLKELTSTTDNYTAAQWICEELENIDNTGIAIKRVNVEVITTESYDKFIENEDEITEIAKLNDPHVLCDKE